MFRLPDGFYLSRIYWLDKGWRHNRNAVVVRVIEYRLEGIEDAGPIYRRLTTLLDHEKAPAAVAATVEASRER